MAYIGIGYSGSNPTFLHDLVNKEIDWLKGDRLPRFYGNDFVVLYDSNTAREFAKKCCNADTQGTIHLYSMKKEL